MAGTEPTVVFIGPDAEAEQVAAILGTRGIRARVHSNSGAARPWGAAGASDSTVVVRAADAEEATRLLDQNPRWRPVDEESEARNAKNSYVFFTVIAAVVGVCGLGLILYVLLR